MSLISPNFDLSLSLFLSNFGQGPFPKIAEKSPEFYCNRNGYSGQYIIKNTFYDK